MDKTTTGSDLAARIKDLKERIDGLTAELAETDPATSNLGAPGMSDPSAAGSLHGLADILFEDVRRTRERRWELRLELEAAEKELAGQVAAAPAAPDISLEYPEISVPDAGPSSEASPAPADAHAEVDHTDAPDLEVPRYEDEFLTQFPEKGVDLNAEVPNVDELPEEDEAPEPLTIEDVANFETPLADPAPVVTSGGPSMGLIAAAGVISVVLAVGAWQVFASSPPSPVAIAATAAPVPTTTSRPAATAAAVVPPAPTAATIRVTGQPAVYSGACNNYSVTFSWIIEGTQSGNFMMRTGKGDAYGPESGPFTLSGSSKNFSWDPASGRLTILGATDSGASPGFRSQITKVNGRDVAGDATSIAAPGHCG